MHCMAKTVRKNVFETNSSSSHSLVIRTIEEKDINILEGVLDIDQLENYSYASDDSENIFIFCDTRNKKLALAFAIMADDYNDDYESDYHSEILKKYKELMDKYGIISIIGNYSVMNEIDIDHLISIIDDDSKVVVSIYSTY